MIPTAKDKPLFTPGPLTTSRPVKEAMLRDLGSRDSQFIDIVRQIRDRLLDLAGVSKDVGYESVIMQGSGTFAIESVLSSAIPPDGKLLVIVNGAYGERIVKIANVHGVETVVVRARENQRPALDEIEQSLAENPDLNMVAVVQQFPATQKTIKTPRKT